MHSLGESTFLLGASSQRNSWQRFHKHCGQFFLYQSAMQTGSEGANFHHQVPPLIVLLEVTKSLSCPVYPFACIDRGTLMDGVFSSSCFFYFAQFLPIFYNRNLHLLTRKMIKSIIFPLSFHMSWLLGLIN
jgi:hypothetical protein